LILCCICVGWCLAIKWAIDVKRQSMWSYFAMN
jgi:hypothetical protein